MTPTPRSRTVAALDADTGQHKRAPSPSPAARAPIDNNERPTR
jgi:hypothetical protein